MSRYDAKLEQTILDQVDNLRYTWMQLLAKSQKVNVHLLSMQPHFQEELRTNLAKFRQEKIDYCNEYKTAGPMEPGLAPREASDRLILFQVRNVTSLRVIKYLLFNQILREYNKIHHVYKKLFFFPIT